MSDASLPPDDEIVSAHLDGAATPAEAGRLDDPRWQQRRAELAAASALVARPVAPPAEVREAAIEAALVLYDRQRAEGLAPEVGIAPSATAHADRAPEVDGPDELAARRRTRPPGASDHTASRDRSHLGVILAVAAAIVVVLLGVGAVFRLAPRSTSSDTASVAVQGAPGTAAPRDQAAGAGDAAASTDPAGGAGTKRAAPAERPSEGASSASPSAPTTTAAGGVGANPSATSGSNPGVPQPGAAQGAQAYRFQSQSLGSISDSAQLRTRVLGALQADTATSSSAPSAAASPALATVARCDSVLRRTDTEIGPIVFSAPAVYGGTDAVVLVYAIDRTAHPAANGAARIYALDAASCAVLDSQTG